MEESSIEDRRRVLLKRTEELNHEWDEHRGDPDRVKELEVEWDAIQDALAKLRREEFRPFHEEQEKTARRALRAAIIASVISGAVAGTIVAAVLILVGVDRLIVVVAGVGAALFFALASFGIAVENRR